MSDDWFERNRRELGDEDERDEPEAPATSAEPEERDGQEEPERFGWDTPSGWPSREPTREQSSYYEDRPREWERAYYEDTPREVLTDEAREERFPARRTRDPLARMFPGLPRSVRVTLDWILTIVGAILIVLALK
ncbi:MAG TPA: hypothetical protein VJ814_03915 [Gaiellaceae bacterium]|nr:hypothetical protein [Gaiellaceae bacterium]